MRCAPQSERENQEKRKIYRDRIAKGKKRRIAGPNVGSDCVGLVKPIEKERFLLFNNPLLYLPSFLPSRMTVGMHHTNAIRLFSLILGPGIYIYIDIYIVHNAIIIS